MKKFLSLLLAFVMVISIFTVVPKSANAVVADVVSTSVTEGDYTYMVWLSSDTAKITEYTGTDALVEIPSMLGGYPVTSIGTNAFSECTSLTDVIIPDSVTSIDVKAFYKCTNLENISIPSSVTRIGAYAFYECTSLANIEIPNSVTSIEQGAFYKCKSITKVKIPNSVTSIDKYTFEYCENLAEVEIPDSITSIGEQAFRYCYNLNEFEIPTSVTSIGSSAFYECTSITNIDIPTSVKSIGGSAFYKCTNLANVKIPNMVTDIGDYTFCFCDSLVNVEIPNSVTNIGAHAFSFCDSLAEIEIPNSVTSIGEDAFCSCDQLTRVTLGNSLTSIGEGAFENCDSITVITIPDSVISIGDFAFNSCSDLAEITLSNSLNSIGKCTFLSCLSLTIVEIPDSVTSIGEMAFRFCSRLTEIEIPDSVISIDEDAFSYSGIDKIAILNPDCVITEGDDYTIPTNATVFGQSQSTAQIYAESHNISFKFLCEGGYTEHQEEVLPGFEATCDKPGLTEGIHCKVCGDILSEQTEIGVVDHSFYWYHTDLMGDGAYDLRCSSCDEFFGRGYLGADGLYYLYAYFDFEEEGFCHYLYNDKAECLGTEKCKLAYWDSDDDYHTAICKCHLILLSEEPHVNINKYNSEGHWTECKTCGYLSEIEEHCYDSESDTNCNACEFTREIIEPITHSIYCVNSAGWENISVFAFNYIFEDGEIAGWESEYLYPGVSMEKIDTKAPNGSDIYVATFNQKYDYLVFVADGVELEQKFKSGYYYENNFGAWYESLDEIPTVLLGDVNGDGGINIMDATEIQRHIAQLSTIPEDRLSCADANKDGQVNIMDATQIQRFIAQLIPSL